jgi:hypothetical protein
VRKVPSFVNWRPQAKTLIEVPAKRGFGNLPTPTVRPKWGSDHELWLKS